VRGTVPAVSTNIPPLRGEDCERSTTASSKIIAKLTLVAVFVGLCSFVVVAYEGIGPSFGGAHRLPGPNETARADEGAATASQSSAPCDPTAARTNLWGMTASEARCRSLGCLDCHQGVEDMHNGKVNLGCIDCHGGHAEVRLAPGAQKGSPEYKDAERKAHIQPRLTELWKTSANPQRSAALLNKESAEFVRFVNPGDLRIAGLSCGTTDCHAR